jgi:hypothetical protein
MMRLSKESVQSYIETLNHILHEYPAGQFIIQTLINSWEVVNVLKEAEQKKLLEIRLQKQP